MYKKETILNPKLSFCRNYYLENAKIAEKKYRKIGIVQPYVS